MGKLNYWTPQEDKILFDEFQNFKSRKWKNISKILRENGFLRGEAECRQRYVNHLDPTLDKNPQISNSQLEILYQKYQVYGPKWCSIQMFLPNRSESKTFFMGISDCSLRKCTNILLKRRLSLSMNQKQMTCKAFTTLHKGFNLLKRAFRKLNYKVNQQSCRVVFASSQAQYLQLLNRILQYKTKIKPLTKKYSMKKKVQAKQNCQISQIIQSENKSINKNNLDDIKQHQILEEKQGKQQKQQGKVENNQKPLSTLQSQMSFKSYSNYPFSQYWNHNPQVLSNFHVSYPCGYMTNNIQPYGYTPLSWENHPTFHANQPFNQYFPFPMQVPFVNKSTSLQHQRIGSEEQKLQQTINLSQ